MRVEDIPPYVSTQTRDRWIEKIEDFDSAEKDEFMFVTNDALLTAPVYVIRDRGSSLESGADIKHEYEYLVDGYGLDDSLYYVVVNARQGGGNRECYCKLDDESHEDGCLAFNNEELEAHPDFILDEDDPFDSTYNVIIFGNNITEEKVKEHRSQHRSQLKRATYLRALKATFTSVLAGEQTWWSINDEFDPQTSFTYQVARNLLKKLEPKYEENLTKLKQADERIKKIKKFQIDEELLDAYRVSDSTRRYILEKFEEYKIAIDAFNVGKAASKEAESLPEDSPLRQFLLEGRGTNSYLTTEKRRGRKVSVRNTYERPSRMTDELKHLKIKAGLATTNLEQSMNNLKEGYQLDNIRKDVEQVETLRLNIDALRTEAWASGWDGSEDDLPDIPSSFYDACKAFDDLPDF